MPKKHAAKYWSEDVSCKSNSLDLEKNVFTWSDPNKIARSLKKSSEEGNRRKGTPLLSAMSMLNFYINRAGKNLSKERLRVLEQAKHELCALFVKNKRKN